ncbi:hypothetical protein KHS38_21335 [Mucilaginibacter sp. Bleaf8]|uniref:hypothetical protein n=1 Tax=Mucilaginibacter sp. Bleaf8 TaxID=2834430 RepID=UPI001BCF6367|nr:hypothetical protein [Mucilaginibacter sp. Bleaf8]MBS7566962.1 hypothetical protein [Mucilaginibacter sp. Bleaf8]
MKHKKYKQLTLSICLLSVIAVSEVRAQPAVIKLNEDQHSANSIAYKINSASTVYYYVGLEKMIDKQWREIVLDISSATPGKTAILRKVKAEEPVSYNYLFKNIPPLYRKQRHRYRFKLTYGPTITSIRRWAVSDTFYIP